MSTIPIYTGQWTDWSRGAVLGSYRTFTVQDTLYIVGATGAYLTMVGGSVWSMWAFVAHQWLSSRRDSDIVDLQHRSVYRNNSSAISAMIDAFWIYWWWKPWTICDSRRTSSRKSWIRRVFPCQAREKRAHDIGLRTCLGLILPALLIFGIFVVVGIFGSLIAHPAYRSDAVLVRDDGTCGITLFDTNIDANNYIDIDALNRTRAAVSYARTCYSPASGVVDSITCSLFATSKLSYFTADVGCPFGDSETSFNQTICAVNSNQAAFALQTDRLDSHEHFGINARKEERVELYKEMVCSPLTFDGFYTNGSTFEKNDTLLYTYGSVPGLSDYTYAYYSTAAQDNVPFSVTALMHNATGPAPWIPVSNLSRSNADVFIVFIAPNSILYRNQVKDPVFQATYPVTELSNINNRFTVYQPDQPVSVVACTEQYSICNPRFNNRCTPLDSQTALLDNIDDLGLNLPQYVTAVRMIYMINDGTTFSSVDGIGPDALQIWNQVHDLVTPNVPDNQWQLEVRGWLETTLAKWQAYMVNYAYNTAALGPHGHIGFPISNDTLDKHWQSQCRNQKISNVGVYRNVSVFGFSLIWAVGGLLIILSFTLRHIVKAWQKWIGRTYDEGYKARQRAWNIDGKLQQQRIALQTAGYYELIGGEDDVPYLRRIPDLPLPFDVVEERHQGTFELNTAWARRERSEGDESRIASVVKVSTDKNAGGNSKHHEVDNDKGDLLLASYPPNVGDNDKVQQTKPLSATTPLQGTRTTTQLDSHVERETNSRISSITSRSSDSVNDMDCTSPLNTNTNTNTIHQQTTTTTNNRSLTGQVQQRTRTDMVGDLDDVEGVRLVDGMELQPLWSPRS